MREYTTRSVYWLLLVLRPRGFILVDSFFFGLTEVAQFIRFSNLVGMVIFSVTKCLLQRFFLLFDNENWKMDKKQSEIGPKTILFNEIGRSFERV